MKKTRIRFLATTVAILLTATACAPKENLQTTSSSNATQEAVEQTPEATASQADASTEADATTDSELPAEKPREQDDFYTAINYDWLTTAVIADDQVMAGVMSDVSLDIEKNLRADVDAAVEAGQDQGDAPENQMLKFYKQATDFETIDAAGVEPVLAYLQQVDDLTTIDELNAAIKEWKVQVVPFGFSPMADMKDATKKSLYVDLTGIILPDKSYYDESNEMGKQMLALYEETTIEMLKKAGNTDEEAQRRTTNMLAVDRRLAQYAQSAEQKSQFASIYNPVTRADFEKEYASSLAVMDVIDHYLPSKVDEIILTNPENMKHIDEIFGLEDGNIDQIKDWMYVRTLRSSADFLSQDMREISNKYSDAILGTTPTDDERDKAAYAITGNVFGPVIGEMYAEKYFSKEAKDNVTEMTKEFIDVYRTRLENNDWLEDATKKEAIKKLDNMVINVGYPDELPKYVPLLKVDESKTYFENYIDLTTATFLYELSVFDEPVDRTEFVSDPQVVNAFYSPMSNSINFPAGILQGAMYDTAHTDSQNYGAIGVVIAHEITHAFDTNGSQYDENGSLKNWWTEQDYAAFEERTKKVIDEFQGLTYLGIEVNGTLTVSENVADLGGLSASLEAAKTKSDFDANEFFSQYATMWASKIRPEAAAIVYSTDVHAPNIWRVNAQIVNFDEFFSTYDVQEGDKMWKAPADRISIW